MSSTIFLLRDGAEGIRTPDLFLAKEAFSRLNYGPAENFRFQIFDFRFGAALILKSEIINLQFRVGLCGLEPQTFPLSEGCSNQLS